MIKVVTGCMFSSKTEYLLSFIRRESYKKNPSIKIIKPLKDTRDNELRTHYGLSNLDIKYTNFYAVDSLKHIPFNSGDTIVIDEFQFFSKGDADRLLTINKLYEDRIMIIVAGLALDSRGEDFGPMPYLMARCDEVEMLYAYCHNCGHKATRTQRKEKVGEQVMVGNKNLYEAACLNCWYPQ